jgi:ankyrin repeat protein
MTNDPNPSAHLTLPAQPNLEHLRNEAKRRLKALRARAPDAKLADAQLAVARDYGFASWRALKTHVDQSLHARVFQAARAGDVETVRRAFEGGFDPGAADRDGRTVHRIAKDLGHEAIELLARDYEARDSRPEDEQKAVVALIRAAAQGNVDELRRLLDERGDLIDARGGGFDKETALHAAAAQNKAESVRLLLERGADVEVRDFPNNATALHFAAIRADLAIVRMLVETGADVNGIGDDYAVGVIGWATCLRDTRADVADYLLRQGARMNVWSAIALDRADDVRKLIAAEPGLLDARMSRNHRRRTALHHAAARNRPAMVRLLLELGADAKAADATGASALTTAALDGSDPAVVAMLHEAGAPLDFVAAVMLRRYDAAEAMLREDPARIGPDGRDTIALHLAISKKNADAVRWLIAHGVAVSAKRVMWDCNHTALHMTIEHNAIDLARLLLDAGADPNVRDDKYDATALGWADFFGRKDFADLVRERGGTM